MADPTFGPLLTASDLRDRVAARAVTLLDVRYRLGAPPESTGRTAFAAGHIPGAAYVDLDTTLAAEPGVGGRHPLPSPDTFLAGMRAAGVDRDRPVVVYDDWSGHAAARAWWLLRHYGHRDVRLLDGGWTAWQALGGTVERGEAPVTAGDFDGAPGAMPVVEADDVSRVGVLVDARAGERYRGEVEPVDPVAGHIPGAVSVPTSANLRPDGTFRDQGELRELYAGVGATPQSDVAVYCGSGVTACHDLVALEVAGVRGALYPGSWSGWITDAARPVATSGCP
ncbi:sulfurtransferase [Nocardioides acrostichi]|uniref:Sulfurtransferase n=1 Tax=Nocardioides acrostichi TaxID=2784339 RepID=A0A930UU97_9ACTN|nr:sulfurtransferase [Nocardioides acrostichi]MBF4160963.1 sulfurtransferase [Nocardioides acrostichi]